MRTLSIIAVLSIFAAPAAAMPVAPLHNDGDNVIMVRKGGGSVRSAKSGRFVTSSSASRSKSTTVRHGKY